MAKAAKQSWPGLWGYDQRGWWYRARRDGTPFDNQRFTERPTYRRACTHAEQDHNTTCAWCGAQLEHGRQETAA